MRFLLPFAALVATPVLADAPRLVRHGQAVQLEVQGKPTLLIGGELGNSSASSEAYMAPHWARLQAMHLNAVFAPVYWELVEPAEGGFDWRSVDALIRGARAHDMHLVLLWFGAYKNSMSTYPPAWVKRDTARFPRAQLPNGQGVEILSTFGEATVAADACAFAALLAHVKAVDSDRNTVVMVQVENEIGMLPIARDYSPAASAAFRAPVPTGLAAYLTNHHASLVPAMRRLWEEHGAKTAGTWTDLFGEGDAAAEVFTAWHYARFADRIAAAGKAAYPLPLYVNVALNRPGRAPGEYPSGGPLPHLVDIWKAGASHLDLVAPDIYFPSFVDIVDGYHRPDNPLFVPEGNNADAAEVPGNALYAFGGADALGFGPFAIDGVDADPPRDLVDAFDLLRELSPAILSGQAAGRIAAVKPRALYDGTLLYEPQVRTLGEWRLTASFADIRAPKPLPSTAGAAAIIVQTGPDEFVIAGRGVTLTAEPVGDGPPLGGIERAEEGRFDPRGAWVPGRRLNGDQTNQGRFVRLGDRFEVQRVRFYRYR